MTALPENVKEAWVNRDGPAVLSTVSSDRTPNSVYVAEIQYEAEKGFVVADNYFNKTRTNIQGGSKASILFITKDRKSYQVKGTLSYHTDGPIFNYMQTWHNPKHPGVAAVCLHIGEVFCGADKLL